MFQISYKKAVILALGMKIQQACSNREETLYMCEAIWLSFLPAFLSIMETDFSITLPTSLYKEHKRTWYVNLPLL